MQFRNLLSLTRLYIDKSDDGTIKKIFLFGLIYFKESKSRLSSELRILGFPFFKTNVNYTIEKFYLCGLPVFKKSTKHKLYDIVIDNIENQYTDIYINYNCSGETYLFYSLFKYINQKENDKVLFLACKKYHIDICKMMCPEIKCIYLPELFQIRSIDLQFREEYKGRIFYNILPYKHFLKLEDDIRNQSGVHYYERIFDTIGLKNENISPSIPLISEDTEKSVKYKAGKIGLNINKFIFLCPESQSNIPLQSELWKNLIDNLNSLGYDVFSNVMKLSDDYGTAKSCFLTFEEAYCLASKSKGIIGLRSGLIEPLTAINNIPIVCLYSDFYERGPLLALSADKVLEAFSLKKLPNVNINNIYEYNVQNYSQKDILSVIKGETVCLK